MGRERERAAKHGKWYEQKNCRMIALLQNRVVVFYTRNFYEWILHLTWTTSRLWERRFIQDLFLVLDFFFFISYNVCIFYIFFLFIFIWIFNEQMGCDFIFFLFHHHLLILLPRRRTHTFSHISLPFSQPVSQYYMLCNSPINSCVVWFS